MSTIGEIITDLYVTYYAYYLKIAGEYNKKEKEDIVADVFCSIWENKKRLIKERGLVHQYIQAAIRYTAISYNRKRKEIPFDEESLGIAESLGEIVSTKLHKRPYKIKENEGE